MAIETTQIKRVFMYGSRELPDPDPSMKPERVKEFYAGVYAELVNADVEGGEFKADRQVFTFKRSVGTKGLHEAR